MYQVNDVAVGEFPGFQGREHPLNLDDAGLRSLLEEAAETLRALPAGLRRAHLTSWPEVVRDSVSYLTPSDGGRPKGPRPCPRTIDRIDTVLGWLFACDPELRQLLWARAYRVPWRLLEEMYGRSHTALRQQAGFGLTQIRRHLRQNTTENKNRKKTLYKV